MSFTLCTMLIAQWAVSKQSPDWDEDIILLPTQYEDIMQRGCWYGGKSPPSYLLTSRCNTNIFVAALHIAGWAKGTTQRPEKLPVASGHLLGFFPLKHPSDHLHLAQLSQHNKTVRICACNGIRHCKEIESLHLVYFVCTSKSVCALRTVHCGVQCVAVRCGEVCNKTAIRCGRVQFFSAILCNAM